MELVPEFTYSASLDPPLMIGAGPLGTRAVVSLAGGEVKGERLSGTLVGAGGDWLLIGADGWGRLDVRGQIQTDDDALIYLSYTGLLQLTDAVMGALLDPSASTEFDDQYFRATPRLETGDERYAWVNSTVFVSRGRMVPGGVEYEVYRVT